MPCRFNIMWYSIWSDVPRKLKTMRLFFLPGGAMVMPMVMLGGIMVILAITACTPPPAADRLQQGQLFPPLVLTDFDGTKVAIDSYRGRFVVFNVWATWCAPCRKELPALQSLSETLDSRQFAVIALSVDADQHLAQEYLTEMGINFARFIDNDKRISHDLLGIRMYPDTFLISADGMLVQKISGERDWASAGMVEALQAAYNGDYDLLNDMFGVN